MFYTPVTTKTSFPYATLGIIGVNVVIYLIQSINSYYYSYFILNFGLVPVEIVAGINIHTLLTSIFIHGSFVHIFFNMYILLIFGPAVERRFKTPVFLIFYLFCGVIAGLFHSYITYIFTPGEADVITIGASGAIFGVMTAFAANFPNQYMLLFFFAPVKAYIAIALFFVLESVLALIGLFGPASGIAHFAHVGGFVSGIAFALIYRKLSRRGPKIRKEKDIEVIYL